MSNTLFFTADIYRDEASLHMEDCLIENLEDEIKSVIYDFMDEMEDIYYEDDFRDFCQNELGEDPEDSWLVTSVYIEEIEGDFSVTADDVALELIAENYPQAKTLKKQMLSDICSILDH